MMLCSCHETVMLDSVNFWAMPLYAKFIYLIFSLVVLLNLPVMILCTVHNNEHCDAETGSLPNYLPWSLCGIY